MPAEGCLEAARGVPHLTDPLVRGLAARHRTGNRQARENSIVVIEYRHRHSGRTVVGFFHGHRISEAADFFEFSAQGFGIGYRTARQLVERSGQNPVDLMIVETGQNDFRGTAGMKWKLDTDLGRQANTLPGLDLFDIDSLISGCVQSRQDHRLADLGGELIEDRPGDPAQVTLGQSPLSQAHGKSAEPV